MKTIDWLMVKLDENFERNRRTRDRSLNINPISLRVVQKYSLSLELRYLEVLERKFRRRYELLAGLHTRVTLSFQLPVKLFAFLELRDQRRIVYLSWVEVFLQILEVTQNSAIHLV